MTPGEIILETVDYYREHDRAVRYIANTSRPICDYINAAGAMCAVGRCLNNPEDFTEDGSNITDLCANSISKLESETDDWAKGDEMQWLDEQLKPQYRGQDMNFWEELQKLHDQDTCWTGHLLSPIGQRQVKEILQQYA